MILHGKKKKAFVCESIILSSKMHDNWKFAKIVAMVWEILLLKNFQQLHKSCMDQDYGKFGANFITPKL